ncbi:MAG: anthranilate phosphoribosyltransferase, partial [Methanobacterium sp.]
VVHGFDDDGNPAMDEISTVGKTKVAFIDEEKIIVKELHPEDFGIKKSNKELLKASSSLDKNREIALRVLEGKNATNTDRARRDLCLVNTGAILFLAGIVKNLPEGVKESFKAIKTGKPLIKLQELVKTSNKLEIIVTSSKY